LADNDEKGVKDHAIVRKYLNGRSEKDALFVMKEANIEQHLCCIGFADVYINLLSHQPRSKVTVPPENVNYPIQVANALPSYLKTRAAQEVLLAIRNDPRPVPGLFHDVILTALKLAEEK